MSRFKKIQLKKRSKNIELDVIQICRLCGVKRDLDELLPIFCENEYDDENLDKKILDCVGIVIIADDRMPPSLCNLCNDKINDFYEYRLMCNATDIQTRILLGLPPQMRPEEMLKMDEEILPSVERAPDKPSASKKGKKFSMPEYEPLPQPPMPPVEISMGYRKGKRVSFPDPPAAPRPPTPPPVRELSKRDKLRQLEAERNMKRPREEEIKEEVLPPAPVIPPKKFKKGTSGPLLDYKICTLCSEEFQLQNDLDGHMIIKHVPNIPKHGCSTCMEGFYTDIDLKDHQKWHKTTKTSYKCIKCPSKFTNYQIYSKHLSTSFCTKPPKFKLFKDIKCPSCNKLFLTQNLYEWHGCFIKTGKGCSKCGQNFSRKKALFKHYIICDQPFSDKFLRNLEKQVPVENGVVEEEIDEKYNIKDEPEVLLEVAPSKKSSLTNTFMIALPKVNSKTAKKNRKAERAAAAAAVAAANSLIEEKPATVEIPSGSKKSKPSASETEYNQLSSLLSSVNEAIAKITSVSSKKKKKKKNKELNVRFKIEPGVQIDDNGVERIEDEPIDLPDDDADDTQDGEDNYAGSGGDDWQADDAYEPADEDEEDNDESQLNTSVITDTGVAVTTVSMKAANILILPSTVMLQPVVSLGIRVVKREQADVESEEETRRVDEVVKEHMETDEVEPVAEGEAIAADELVHDDESSNSFDPSVARNIKKEKGLQLQAAHKQHISFTPPLIIKPVKAGPVSSKSPTPFDEVVVEPLVVCHVTSKTTSAKSGKKAGPASSKPKPQMPVVAKPKAARNMAAKVTPATSTDTEESSLFDPELARNIKKEKGLEHASVPPPTISKPAAAQKKKPVKTPMPAAKRFAMHPSLKLKIKKEQGMLNASLHNQAQRTTPSTSTEEPTEQEEEKQQAEPVAATAETLLAKIRRPVAKTQSINERNAANFVKKMIFRNPAALALKIKKERGEMNKKTSIPKPPAQQKPASPPKPQKPKPVAQKKAATAVRIKKERVDPEYDKQAQQKQKQQSPEKAKAGEAMNEDEYEEDDEAHEEPEDYLGINPMSLILQATAEENTAAHPAEEEADEEVNEEAEAEETEQEMEAEAEEEHFEDEETAEVETEEADNEGDYEPAEEQVDNEINEHDTSNIQLTMPIITQVTSGADVARIATPDPEETEVEDENEDLHPENENSEDIDDEESNDMLQHQQLSEQQPMVSIPIISSVTSVSRKDHQLDIDLQHQESQRIPHMVSIPIISSVVSCAATPPESPLPPPESDDVHSNNGTEENDEQISNDTFSENGLDNRLAEPSQIDATAEHQDDEEVIDEEPPRKKMKKIVRNPFAEIFRKKQLERQKEIEDALINATVSVAEENSNLDSLEVTTTPSEEDRSPENFNCAEQASPQSLESAESSSGPPVPEESTTFETPLEGISEAVNQVEQTDDVVYNHDTAQMNAFVEEFSSDLLELDTEAAPTIPEEEEEEIVEQNYLNANSMDTTYASHMPAFHIKTVETIQPSQSDHLQPILEPMEEEFELDRLLNEKIDEVTGGCGGGGSGVPNNDDIDIDLEKELLGEANNMAEDPDLENEFLAHLN